ncbi:MAG: fimbrial protein FimV, partial [Polaromonas sp.]|nr:fimbrial protein FimV [Polaromonas sp.]
MSHRCSWRLGVLASAIALLGSLAAVPVHALGLGRVTVQSVLGEALRAEIEVPEITADEAATLRVGVASADAFKAAGLEYTAAVVGIQVSLQKRADGRSFLRLSSSRPVTEPFVDLILEANWASGRVVRDYTMLFDPPNLRQATAPMAAPTAPVLSRPATPPASAAANKPSFPSSPPPAQADVRQPPAAPVSASNGQKVTVKPGDTAGKIATQNKPASISLNQMLVALLRSNPDAFIGGNVNRLKSGALLDIPSSEEAGTVSTSEATSTIIAQAKDFNDFRQKLAAGVQTTQADIANRKTGGKVQAKVEDRAAVATKPDKLTLSKGAIQSKSAAEDKIAKDKQAKDASSRVAELTKNIGDLNKIAGGPATSPAAGAAPASASKPLAAPGVQIAAGPSIAAVPAPASPVIAAAPTAVVGTASVAALATASSATLTPTAVVPPVVVASAPVVAAPVASAPVAVKKPVVLPPPSPPEPSLIDELTINPLVLPGLGLLLALLAGFGFYRYKKRNDELSVDSSFLETRLQPDSFFGASGGQRIDTSDGGRATGSSPVYSPSQPDAADDVDPVAEADVYLAYGRDLQAEEILKEALRTSPTRVAIHAKLSEIYATRRDLQGFEVIAADAFRLARGTGPEWAYICELGRDLDLTNPMYRPSGQPQQGSAEQNMAASLSVAATAQQVLASSPTAAASSVNFDLDVSINDKPVPTTAVEPMKRPDFTPPPTAPVAPTHEPDPEPTVALQTKREPAFG